ncbi:MAG: hypothetical protein GXO10_03020 [Crenarchaeota archaeon]|nr:hypothetical protein [Thermoproteota archaeon]
MGFFRSFARKVVNGVKKAYNATKTYINSVRQNPERIRQDLIWVLEKAGQIVDKAISLANLIVYILRMCSEVIAAALKKLKYSNVDQLKALM